jgi:flagellar motor switch protein FliN/FliY
MSVLESISVDMTVVLGSAQLPIRQVLKMGRGAVIPLDCGEDDPTLVYVNNQLVARGRISVSYDQMSIEITDVVKKVRG